MPDEPKPNPEGDPTDDGDRNDDVNRIDGLGEKGKAALKQERDAREAAETKFTEAERELKALRKRESEREEAERRRQEAEAAQRGEFEELAKKREAERDEWKDKAAGLQATLDRYQAAMKAGVDARWKDIPERVRTLYKGDPEDALARWEYLNDPDVVDLAKELAGDGGGSRGNGVNPPIKRGAIPSKDQMREEMRQRMRMPVR